MLISESNPWEIICIFKTVSRGATGKYTDQKSHHDYDDEQYRLSSSLDIPKLKSSKISQVALVLLDKLIQKRLFLGYPEM